MVCLGNICRSPLAEGILQAKAKAAGLNWKVDSAGTNSYHIGEKPHPLSIKVAKHNGIDITHQRARKFVPEDLDRFDLIFAMAPDVLNDMRRITKVDVWQHPKVKLMMDLLHPGENMEVPDPYYGGEDGYHEVFQMLSEAIEELLASSKQ